MNKYTPYSPDWHRCRYLSEALTKYMETPEGASVVVEDIIDILHEWVDDHETKADKLRHVIDALS